jgi:hypothetical protein
MPRAASTRKAKVPSTELDGVIIGSREEVKKIPNLEVFTYETTKEESVKPEVKIEPLPSESTLSTQTPSQVEESVLLLENEQITVTVQEVEEIKRLFTKENFQRLSKAVLFNPLFSLFLINLLFDGILLKGTLWLFIAICIFSQDSFLDRKDLG